MLFAEPAKFIYYIHQYPVDNIKIKKKLCVNGLQSSEHFNILVMNNKNEQINRILSAYLPGITEQQTALFLQYYEMLIEKNKVMNLTAITDFDEVVIKHFADSLSIISVFDISANMNTGLYDQTENRIIPEENQNIAYADNNTSRESKTIRVLDIGTGAGFPGIPLKIAYPGLNITLLDSLEKRVGFLNDVINTLNLEDICAIHSRAEDLINQKSPEIQDSCHTQIHDSRKNVIKSPDNNTYREHFDLVVSRAVAKLNILCEYALPYLKVGGSFIAYKAESAEEEAKEAGNALKILGGEIADIKEFTLPSSDYSRTLIRIQKTGPTPDKYPRRSGIPSKKPL